MRGTAARVTTVPSDSITLAKRLDLLCSPGSKRWDAWKGTALAVQPRYFSGLLRSIEL
jgi:hypothetical protein